MRPITRTLSQIKPKPLPPGVSPVDVERQTEERAAATELRRLDEDTEQFVPATMADLHYLLPSAPLTHSPLPSQDRGCLGEAKSFLLHLLADGPQTAAFLLTAAASGNIAKRTLDRAKKSLNIHAEKRGAVWFWRLP